MEIDTPQPKTIIEQDCFRFPEIYQQATKGAIKLLEKGRPKFLVKVNDVTGVTGLEGVSPGSQVIQVRLIYEVFPREQETNVLGFIPNRQTIGEGFAMDSPTGCDSQRPLGKSTGSVCWFVQHGFDHLAGDALQVGAPLKGNNSG
jgi:hypothetical protein